MTWLRLVPAWCWVALGALAIIGVQTVRVSDLKDDLAAEQRKYSDHIDDDERAQLKASEDARTEEQRRQSAVEVIQNETVQKVAAAKADADQSGDALERLQQRYAQLLATSRACGNSITSSLGQAADNTARVSTDVLGRVGQAARQYAAIADERGIAGSGCERAYDAIKKPGG